jgi:hypothetical protein
MVKGIVITEKQKNKQLPNLSAISGTLRGLLKRMGNNMIVYTVETIGGQITSYEANEENLPKFLEKPVKESFKKYGFCMWKTPEYECIIYPTLQAAQHAIQWTIEN